MEHESGDDTNCNWYARNDPQKFGEEAGRDGNRRMSKNHRDYSIVIMD